MSELRNKTVHLSYFAGLRDTCGISQESLETEASTARHLYLELQDRYGFSFPADSLKVSINDTFSSWETELKEDDCIVFIPPVSGG